MTGSEYKTIIDEWMDAHLDEMIEDLKMLVRIPSVRGEARDGKPYGEEAARVLKAMEGRMAAYGLKTRNYDNYCVTGDLKGENEKTLDILAHLDVVPVTDTWTKTQPFEPLVEGDLIYGRGTSDDKGPAVATLYALRALNELGIPLRNGVRLICGSDEECGSSDLAYYYSIEKEALFTFSPDADFPLINIEKGRLASIFTKKGQQSQAAGEVFHVLSLSAGEKENVIPGTADLILAGGSYEDLLKAAKETERATGTVITIAQKEQNQYKVTVAGKAGHAAYPMSGVNALTAALRLLEELPLCSRDGENALLAAARFWPFEDHSGRALGVECSDEESGELTMSLNILHYQVKDEQETEYELSGIFDCRAPISANDENLTKIVRMQLADAGIDMEQEAMSPAHYVPADSELVRKLLESYEVYFGKKGEPIAIGGGTYVHGLKRGVAFGCAELEVDNRMHGDDEFAKLSILVKSAKIFADAILRLCG